MSLDDSTGNGPCSFDHLQYGVSLAVAKIDYLSACTVGVLEPMEGADVRVSKVGNVHVIPNAGAIGGRIIAAENRDCVPATKSSFQYQWDQMGFRLMGLANPDFSICAGGIEVS